MNDTRVDLQADGTRGDLEFHTIPRLLDLSKAKYESITAIEEGSVQITYGQLYDSVMDAGRALMAMDIRPHDRVAIWAPNISEWIIAALAIQTVGATVVTINTRYKGDEAAFILQKSGARALFTIQGFLDTDYLELLQQSDVELPKLEHQILLRGDKPPDALSWSAFLERKEEVSEQALIDRRNAVSPTHVSDILFTSGTTGHPKGVVVNHSQTLRAYRDWSHVVGLQQGDRYLVVVPFFHCFGYKAGWLACLMMGATIVPQPVFDVDQVLERIGPDRITVLPGPPALYQSILAKKGLNREKISSLRLAVTGAAVIPVQLIHDMKERLGFDTVITGYGLTEASGIATMCRYDDPPKTIAQTSGRAIPGVEVKIVDTNGQPLPANETGEVMIRGYNIMQEYFDESEATQETINQDGWLRTGDIGLLNEHGYIRITDRQKDMFLVGGFNAYPAEIENTLLQRKEIAQAAVIGVPDDRLGEVGAAYLVLKPDSEIDTEELHSWCREHMANFKVPRHFRVVTELPMNASGKVTKFVLRENFESQALNEPI